MALNKDGGPSFHVSHLWEPIKNASAITLILAVMGCGFLPTEPDITMPTPKAYTDDQVLKTFAERRAALRSSVALNIPTDTIQELLRIKQQSQTTINISGAPASIPVPSSPPPFNPPTLPPLTDLTPPSNFGLPAEGMLRKRVALDQNLMGYELLFLGDNRFLDKTKQAVLLRIDVSVNNFSYLSRKWRTEPRFVMIGFKVAAKKDSDTMPGKNVSVYTLQPEYTSVVGEESLLSSRIENYSGQAMAPSGTTMLLGGGAYQRASEEGLLALVETPVQFAVYTDEADQFAFAFGPRRRVIKRSWMNPYRIFGDTHAINYEFEPGLRTVFALLELPIEATLLDVQVKIHNEFESEDALLTTARQKVTKFEGQCISSTQRRCFTIPLLKPSEEKLEKTEIIPSTVYTGMTSQHLLIRTVAPITSETDVFVGSFAVPKTSVTVLGRHRLKVALPSSEQMDAVVKNTVCGKLDLKVYLVTPDRNPPFEVGDLTLKAAAPSEKPKDGECKP